MEAIIFFVGQTCGLHRLLPDPIPQLIFNGGGLLIYITAAIIMGIDDFRNWQNRKEKNE